MVELLRIDERLLHGQVAISWSQNLRPDAIAVINDEASKNELQKMAIKMAKPSNVKMAIKSVEDGIALLNNPTMKKMKIFVVVRTTEDALRLLENVEGINQVNAGGMTKKTEDSLKIDDYLYVSKNDIENFKKMKDYVKMIDCRVVPDNQKNDIFKLISRKGE